jgi:multidrug efflux pump subunit AcrB
MRWRAVTGCGRDGISWMRSWRESTTLTTIGAFVPLLLFVGGDFWPSLAVVLAGGVAGATLMASLMVPAGYRLLVARG